MYGIYHAVSMMALLCCIVPVASPAAATVQSCNLKGMPLSLQRRRWRRCSGSCGLLLWLPPPPLLLLLLLCVAYENPRLSAAASQHLLQRVLAQRHAPGGWAEVIRSHV